MNHSKLSDTTDTPQLNQHPISTTSDAIPSLPCHDAQRSPCGQPRNSARHGEVTQLKVVSCKETPPGLWPRDGVCSMVKVGGELSVAIPGFAPLAILKV